MRTSALTKKLVMLSMLTALGIALQLFENMLPFVVNLPGGKLGLANVAVLLVLYIYGLREAAVVAVMRSILGSLLFGGVVGLLYSFTGSIVSLAVMGFAKSRLTKLSIVGVSVLGACMHSAAQVCVASVLLSSVLLYTYLPPLLVLAVVCGVFTGFAAKFAVRYMR